MNKKQRDLINALNSQKSTGPTSNAGRQRASMNAFKHGLTGNRMILQAHEHEAYQRLAAELNKDLTPKTELEHQLVQKLIDCHTRLNRIAALDGNILNFGLTQNETDADHLGDQDADDQYGRDQNGSDQSDATETIAAQCRSWIENADSFEKLGRYESRISRQMLQYTKELERLQTDRAERERDAAWKATCLRRDERHEQEKAAEQAEAQAKAEAKTKAIAEARQAYENKTTTINSGSFRQTPSTASDPSGLPAPKLNDFAPAA
jgi:hypothetical protein